MATYAVGDIQGCFEPLRRLVAAISFDPGRDHLWLVGDLVNRGPDSLGVLRWAMGLGGSATVVLGNHELHLLGRAAGVREPARRDTLDAVLAAPDADRILDWVATRPFVAGTRERLLVHAGVHPRWSAADAFRLGAELSQALSGPRRRATLEALAGDEAPRVWSDGLRGAERLRAIAAVTTRMRTIGRDGGLDLDFVGPPGEAPDGAVPWFRVPRRTARATTIVFGHWAALGLVVEPRLVALDTGCSWGNRLTAVRLDDGRVFDVPAQPASSSSGG